MNADLSAYFIAPDCNEQPTLWRENAGHPDRPTEVVNADTFREDPAIWALIVTAVEAQDRCADCNAYLPDEGHGPECGEVDGAPDHQWQVTEPDAVYATDDEPGDLLMGARR